MATVSVPLAQHTPLQLEATDLPAATALELSYVPSGLEPDGVVLVEVRESASAAARTGRPIGLLSPWQVERGASEVVVATAQNNGGGSLIINPASAP